MKKWIVLLIVLLALPVWAGEKEMLEKDVAIFQLQLNNLQLQAQIINSQFPQIDAKLKDAQDKLKKLEDKKEVIKK